MQNGPCQFYNILLLDFIVTAALTCKRYSNIADSQGGADFNCSI